MSDLYQNGGQQFGELIIPESFEEALSYAEQLIWLFLNKQNKLVEGDNITLTPNSDGTVTISSEASGGATYRIKTTTPGTGYVAAYILENMDTEEQSGVTIQIPEDHNTEYTIASATPDEGYVAAYILKNTDTEEQVGVKIQIPAGGGSGLPAGGVEDEILMKASDVDGDAIWMKKDNVYPILEELGGFTQIVKREPINGYAVRPGLDLSIENLENGNVRVDLTNNTGEEATDISFFIQIACDGYGMLDISVIDGDTSIYPYFVGFEDPLNLGEMYYKFIAIGWWLPSLSAGASDYIVMEVTDRSIEQTSTFHGVTDTTHNYFYEGINAENGIPASGGRDGFVLVKQFSSGVWDDPANLYPQITQTLGGWYKIERYDLNRDPSWYLSVSQIIDIDPDTGNAILNVDINIQNVDETSAGSPMVPYLNFLLDFDAVGTLALTSVSQGLTVTLKDYDDMGQTKTEWIQIDTSGVDPIDFGDMVTVSFTLEETTGTGYINGISDPQHSFTLEQIATLPTGGTAGQVLTKVDGTDFNAEWETPSGGGDYDLVTFVQNSPGGSSATWSGAYSGTTNWSADGNFNHLEYIRSKPKDTAQIYITDASSLHLDLTFNVSSQISIGYSEIKFIEYKAGTVYRTNIIGSATGLDTDCYNRIYKHFDIVDSTGTVVAKGQCSLQMASGEKIVIRLRSTSSYTIPTGSNYHLQIH